MVKDKGGRPAVNIDLKTVEKLAGMGSTDEDMAGWFEVTTKTIERRRKNNPAFREACKRGRGKYRCSLRMLQTKSANSGNVTMLIWLGKQHLGQTDKLQSEHSGPGGAPIEVVTQTSEVAGRIKEKLDRLREGNSRNV